MTEPLSYAHIARDLVDLARLAHPPAAGERAGSWTSYDRRSQYDSASDRYVDWDANDDGTGYIRREGDDIVVFEQTGPGAVWRVWSAYPARGHIKIYIDGAEVPVVDIPFEDFFGREPAALNPMGISNVPELTPTLSRGRNRFIPIPYQHSCKITLAPAWGMYYHFTYRTYAPGSVVESYTGALDSSSWMALAQIDRTLAQRGYTVPAEAAGGTSRVHQVVVPARGRSTPITYDGAGVINALTIAGDCVRMDAAGGTTNGIAIAMYWDGEANPSVWAPLGDFFGVAPGIQYARTFPVGCTPGFAYTHWQMPFSAGAAIVFENDSDVPQTFTVTLSAHTCAHSAVPGLRFHAKWHRDAFLAQVQDRGRAIDWPILVTEGCGRFVGMHLHVENTWDVPAEAPESFWYGRWDKKTIDWWWGEGDEKFWVDGEVFPSTFGTGSEDYIGYAWAAEPPFAAFDSAYAAQPYTPIDGNGHTSVSRFHIGDDVPFQRSFVATIEKYKPNRWGTANVCRYAVTAFWYLAPGGRDGYERVESRE